MRVRQLTRCAAVLVAALVLGVGGARAQATQATRAGGNASQAPLEYRLGGGDVVRINVFQNPDLALDGRIGDNGLLSYPLLGQIHLGGLSVTQAEKLIADGLKNGNFVKQPQVTIVVTQVRGNQVSVLGQVNRAGRYPLETPDLRLSDMIAIAGGVAANGSDIVVVTGTRAGKDFRYQVDLPTLFGPGGREKDMVVQNGDAIWVDRQPLVYIYGEVQRPGAMRLEREMTLIQVLASGGGLTLRGTEKGIAVHRRNPATDKIEVIRPAMTDKLQDGDVVYVRESLF